MAQTTVEVSVQVLILGVSVGVDAFPLQSYGNGGLMVGGGSEPRSLSGCQIVR